MNLAAKRFARGTKSCPMRSDCKTESDRRYFNSLFAIDWEVFVIRRTDEKDNFEWFTLCCEAGRMEANGDRDHRAATRC
jgi:hypothetical protein